MKRKYTEPTIRSQEEKEGLLERCIKMRGIGVKWADISEELGVPASTLRTWVRHGVDGPGPGRPAANLRQIVREELAEIKQALGVSS